MKNIDNDIQNIKIKRRKSFVIKIIFSLKRKMSAPLTEFQNHPQ